MVSKASEDLPEPLSPVTTVSVLRGISTSMFLRLCWRAPRTEILVIAMELLSEALDRNQAGLSFRNVDRSAEVFDSRSAQLYSVFYYTLFRLRSIWVVTSGGREGR